MDIVQEDNGKSAARTVSDISFASSASTKVQKSYVPGVHMQFDPGFTSSKHLGHRKIKFMCSSAGKILPRPSDMKLRYVGGETRMVSVPRYIQYAAFLGKMIELYGPDIVVKYQLPEEDLDALVSVSSDEDLENMLEECDRLNSTEGLSRLRVFVFPASEHDVQDLEVMADYKTSEQKFVDAVNATILTDFMHTASTTAKPYVKSDSYTEAYRAWNGIHSQEKGSFFHNNPQSQVLPQETNAFSKHVHPVENINPSHVPGPISPFSYSNFMGQPTFSSPFVAMDALGNDLKHIGVEGSSTFFQNDVDRHYAENAWDSSSGLQIYEDVRFNDRGVDEAYRPDHSFAAAECTVGMQESDTGDLLSKVEPFDDLTDSDNQGKGDPLLLSPGAFLQKQLLSTSPGNLSHEQCQTIGNKFLGVENMPPFPVNSGFSHHKDKQQAFCKQFEWEALPVYDSSIALDQETQAFGHMDGNSLHIQAPGIAEEPQHPKEISAAIFPASSGPSSPLRKTVQNDIRFDKDGSLCYNSSAKVLPSARTKEEQDMQGNVTGIPDQTTIHTQASSTAEIPPHPKEISAIFPATSGLASPLGKVHNDTRLDKDGSVHFAKVLPPARTNEGQAMQMNVMGIPDQSTIQDFNREHPTLWTTTDTESYPFSSSKVMLEEEGMNQRIYQGQAMQQPLDPYSNVPSIPDSSFDPTKHPSENENMGDFSCFRNRLHDSGFSSLDETFVPGRSDDYATLHHENEHPGSLSCYSEALPPPSPNALHTLDMLSDLLRSCQLGECLQAPSSTADSFKSRSTCSLNEPLPQEFDHLGSRAGGKSSIAPIEGLDFPISTQGNSECPRFPTFQNSMASREQFDEVTASSFTSAFNNGNSLFAEGSTFRNMTEMTIGASDHARVPEFTSLIETWEASLLQDEDVQEHDLHEGAQEDISLNPVFDKEVAQEEPQVELEELDEFESFDHGPMNAAAIAEQEAINRGLQMIRNCDLEELRELGSGTFGTVYHGKWRGTDVAIKRIKASCFAGRLAERDRLVADFWREAYILGQLHHPNVVAFYGVVPDGPGGTLATVTEYMVNGSLKQVLQNKDRTLDRRKRLLIAMDAAFGMEYLHGKNVVHFDIKCENLLVNLRDTQRPICKVGDLGLSKVKQQTFVSGGVRGTLPWMAPELLNGSSSLVSEKVDVFSFGIVMWELLTGEEPYANMHYGAIIGGIVNNTLRPTVPRWCDPAWRSLMEKCWAADPAERPTFLEIAGTLRAMEASIAAKGPGQARILEMYQ